MKWTPAGITIAAVVAAAGLALAGAALTGIAPLQPLFASSAGAEEKVTKTTFAGEIAPEIKRGTIDFRTFQGRVHLIGWDQAAYEVTVLVPETEGQKFGDLEIKPTFTAEGTDAIALKLLVEQKGTAGGTLAVSQGNGGIWIGDGWKDVEIVAYVPRAIEWTDVFVCSGVSGGFFSAAFDQVFTPAWSAIDQVFGADDESHEERDFACIEASEHVEMNVGLKPGLPTDDAAETNETAIPFKIEGLFGGNLTTFAHYATLELDDARFENVVAVTHYGEILGGVTAKNLAAVTHYGGVKLLASADNVVALTHYGNVALTLLGGASGAVEAMSHYGNVLVKVPKDAARGYDATAATQYGEVVITLADAEVETSSDDEEEEPESSDLTALLGKASSGQAREEGKKSRHQHGETATGKTVGFESKVVQVSVNALTHYGNVVITDGKVPKAMKDDGNVQ